MMRLISMANLIKKTLQDKYLSDFFVSLARFYSEWIGGVGFWEMYKKK